jgi:hypothetical protein
VLRFLHTSVNWIGLRFNRKGKSQVRTSSASSLRQDEKITMSICLPIRFAVLAFIISLAGLSETQGSIFSEDFEDEPENSLFPSLYGITGQQSANTSTTTGTGNWWSAMLDNTYNPYVGDPLNDPYIGNPSEPGFSLTGNSSTRAVGFLTGTAGNAFTYANAFRTVNLFSTTLDEVYDVFFDAVDTTIGTAVLRPEISINGGLNWTPIGAGVAPPIKTWSSYAFQFIGSGGPTLFRISDLTFGGVGNDFMIDNVIINSAVPEASALAVWCLLGLSCAGLCSWRSLNPSRLTTGVASPPTI